MVLLRWGLFKARGSFVCDVGVGVLSQGLAPLDGGDPDVLVSRVLAGSAEEDVQDGLAVAFLWGGEVPEGLDGELGTDLL